MNEAYFFPVHKICSGFVHEQARYDRNAYIDIDFTNIREGFESQYNYDGYQQLEENNLRYDYSSIMHYDPKAFAKDKTKQVMWAKKPDCQATDDPTMCEQQRQVSIWHTKNIQLPSKIISHRTLVPRLQNS